MNLIKKKFSLIIVYLMKSLQGQPSPHDKKKYFSFSSPKKFDPTPNNKLIKILTQFLISGQITTNNLYLI